MSALRNFFSRFKRGPRVHPFPAPRHPLEGAVIVQLGESRYDQDGNFEVDALVSFPDLPYGKLDGTLGTDKAFCERRTLSWNEYEYLRAAEQK